MSKPLTIAISKGRILEDFLPLLSKLDINSEEDPSSTRKLILQTDKPGIQFIIVRATDVPTYVEHGAADMGIAGKDVLLEYGSDDLYEPVDLKIASCRLMVAAKKDQGIPQGRLRVATKYVNIAREYFARQGRQVEIIKLYGSMELAPLLDLADVIVDLVDTGNTLKANGLEPLELITNISSRLVVNKGSMKMKQDLIKPLLKQLESLVSE